MPRRARSAQDIGGLAGVMNANRIADDACVLRDR
jgi:hypothetical protein